MAGFNAVWSIDIGKFSLKAVHLRRTGAHVVVEGTDHIEYDVGPEGVDSIGGAKEALQIFCSRNSVRDPVVVCLPGQDTLPRFIKIVADDEKKLEEIVNFEARQQIPFPIQDVVWDWQLVPRDYVAGQEREIGIFAARRETVDDLLLELGSHGIRGQQVTCNDLGLLNFVQYELRPKAPSVILDIGAEHTALILLDNGAFWIRALPFSGNQITRELSQRFRLTFAEAERLKRQAAKSPQKDKILLALQKVLGDFATEVQRSVAFYRRQITETNFETAYLLGQGSFTLGLAQIVQERLGWKVHRVASLARMRPVDGMDVAELRARLASLAPALGAGLQGLGVAATNVDLMPHEQQVQLAFTRRRKMVFVAGGVLLVALLVVGRLFATKASSADKDFRDSLKIVKELDDWAAKLGDAAGIPALEGKLNAVETIGQERRYFTQCVVEVNKLFAAIEKKAHEGVAAGNVIAPLGEEDPRARAIFVAKVDDETEAEKQTKAYAESVHKNMAWLLQLEVSLKGIEAERTGPGAATSRPPAAGASKTAAKPAIVPLTYSFTLTGAVPAQENEEASSKLVEERVLKPLTRQLEANRTLKGHVTRPTPQMLPETGGAELGWEEDKLFQKNWLLAEPRLLKKDESGEGGKGKAPEVVTTTTQESKYYFFGIRWSVSESVLGAGKAAAAPEEEAPTTTPPEDEGAAPAEPAGEPKEPADEEPPAETTPQEAPSADADASAGAESPKE